MTQHLDERKIIEALNKVATIDGSSDIVTAGAVSGVVIKDGHIGFTIEIDPKDKDKADQLRTTAEKAVLALDGVTNPQNVGMIIRSAIAAGVVAPHDASITGDAAAADEGNNATMKDAVMTVDDAIENQPVLLAIVVIFLTYHMYISRLTLRPWIESIWRSFT